MYDQSTTEDIPPDPHMVNAVGDSINELWPHLLNDGIQYRVAGDALDAAVRYQEEQAEALADKTLIGPMGSTPEGGWGFTVDAPDEITAVLIGWARSMLRAAPNYVERALTFTDRQAGERFTITVQRVGRLTPHEARLQAEAARDDLAARIDAAITLINEHDGPDASSADHNRWVSVRDALTEPADGAPITNRFET